MEMNSPTHWVTPPYKEKNSYLSVCKSFIDDKKFFNFRRNKAYGKILENNSRGMAIASMVSIYHMQGEHVLKQYLPLLKTSDSVGNPIVYPEYDLSPSTLRYFSVFLRLAQLLQGKQPKRILEIGGGYGGLCKVLSNFFDFEEYTIVELPEAEQLCRKYLSNFPEVERRVTYSVSGEYDLFIADASLAECDAEAQLYYASLAAKCPYVYILYNSAHVEGMKENLSNIIKLFDNTPEGHKYQLFVTNPFNEKALFAQSIFILTFRRL